MGHVGKQAAYLITFTDVAGGVKVNLASGGPTRSSPALPTANNGGGRGRQGGQGEGNKEVIKVDFFALLYIVKKTNENREYRVY